MPRELFAPGRDREGAGAGPPPWRRVLAVRLDNIGDVVMLSPALRALRQALPESHITLMVSPAGAKAVPLLPWIDDFMVLRAVWQDASLSMPLDPQSQSSLVEDLRSRNFDAALIFTSFSQSPYPPAFACYLAGIPVRAGQSREFGGSILSHWIKPPADSAHQVERNLHLLAGLGIEARNSDIELRVTGPDQEAAGRLLAETGIRPGDDFVAIAPGASCAARRYDPYRFTATARLIASHSGLPLVVVGAERDADAATPLLCHAAAASLIGRDTVPALAGILSRAALVITNNSVPMHIADAFARPQVVLYSGTELVEQWRPRKSPARLLRREVPCSPCYRFTCPYAMECLDIPPEEVAQAALDLLEAPVTSRGVCV